MNSSGLNLRSTATLIIETVIGGKSIYQEITMTFSKQSQFNIELLKLQQKYQTEQELLDTSKHLVSRSLNLAIENKSFREAFSALIVKEIMKGR